MESTPKIVHPEDDPQHGYDLLLRWINPLIEVANNRTISEKDVWPCPESEDIEEMCSSFWKAWYAEIDFAEQQNRKPDIKKALFKVFGTRMIKAGIAQMIFVVVTFGQPFIIAQLVDYVQSGTGGIGVGVGYALGLAALSLTGSIAFSITIEILRRLGVALRSCMILAVYEQALKLTTASRTKNTVGKQQHLYLPYYSSC